MYVVRPVPVSPVRLISSNAPENDYVAWDFYQTYLADEKVIYTPDVVGIAGATTHRIYKSLQAGNLSKTPDQEPTWWLDISATNRWAMFDTVVNSQTVVTGNLTVDVQHGVINSIALMELDCASVNITMRLPSGTVLFNQDYSLRVEKQNSMYEYLNEPIDYRRHLLVTDLPTNATAITTITLTPITGITTTKCGVCVFGLARFIGMLDVRPSIRIKDYSNKITNDFGQTELVKRATSKIVTCHLLIMNDDIDEVFRIMSSLNSEPLAWFGLEKYELTAVFGYYGELEITLEDIGHSFCNLTIEGLI